MKTYILLLFLLPSLMLSAQQPQWLNPKPFGGKMYDIEFFDTTRGLMVGRIGYIALTTDGAQSWELINSGTSSDLQDIEICGPQSAVIQGDTFLLRTDDGGNTFTPMANLDSGWHYSSLSMVNQNLGYASCQDDKYQPMQSKFGVTHDGGLTWIWSDFPPLVFREVYELDFADSLHGVAIIRKLDNIFCIQTLDGGQAWSEVISLMSDGGFRGSALSHDNNGVYYMAFSHHEQQSYWPRLFKSIDYGVSWVSLVFDPGSLVGWSDLKCLGDSIVIAAGSYYSGKMEKEVTNTANNIFISTDAGTTWYKGTKPTGTSINNSMALGIRTPTDAYLWTSNYDNMELFTTHNLSHFTPETGTLHAFIKEMDFKGSTWYMLSGTSEGNINSTIYKSVNSGITWDTLSSEISTYFYFNATMFELIDGVNGLIAGMDDMSTRIYRTTDGGLTWTESFVGQQLPKSLNSFGYGATYFMEGGSESNLVFSSNCGLTWQSVSIPFDSINHMHFITPDTGFLFGGGKTTANGGYYLTQNAGQSWAFHDLGIPCLNRGQMLSVTDGYVSTSGNRDRLYYVHNDLAQQVFEADTIHSITDFAFSDAEHGYLITTFSPLYSSSLNYSKIHYTSDGGQTWQTYGPYSPLNGVKTFYDGNGYAYGDYGVLLQLGNGFPVGQNTLPGASNQAVAWPNPATTGLQITLPSFAQCGAQLSISNGLGEVVLQQQVSGKVVNVAIYGLPAGFYVYTLSNATQKATGKFVVK